MFPWRSILIILAIAGGCSMLAGNCRGQMMPPPPPLPYGAPTAGPTAPPPFASINPSVPDAAASQPPPAWQPPTRELKPRSRIRRAVRAAGVPLAAAQFRHWKSAAGRQCPPAATGRALRDPV